MEEAGVSPRFEKIVLRYERPTSHHRYTPDFEITTRGTGKKILIETKGMFTAGDRKKMVWVIDQHPELDIRIVFQNANARIYKNSPTRCFEWCDQAGIKWAHKTTPEAWLDE